MYIRQRLLKFRQIYILTNHFANNTSTVNLLVVKILCTLILREIKIILIDKNHPDKSIIKVATFNEKDIHV